MLVTVNIRLSLVASGILLRFHLIFKGHWRIRMTPLALSLYTVFHSVISNMTEITQM